MMALAVSVNGSTRESPSSWRDQMRCNASDIPHPGVPERRLSLSNIETVELVLVLSHFLLIILKHV